MAASSEIRCLVFHHFARQPGIVWPLISGLTALLAAIAVRALQSAAEQADPKEKAALRRPLIGGESPTSPTPSAWPPALQRRHPRPLRRRHPASWL